MQRLESTSRISFVPEAGTNLLGQDLMSGLGIGLAVDQRAIEVSLNLLSTKEEERILPEVWTEEGNGGGPGVPPVQVNLKSPGDCQKETVPSSCGRKARTAPCMYPGLPGCLPSTPHVTRKETDGSHRLVQDLRAVNQIVQCQLPVVPNLYTLLSKTPYSHNGLGKWI